MKYEIVSDRPCFIDAIGELQPGQTVSISPESVDLFKTYHNVRLTEAKFPPDVQVTVVVEEDD